MKSISARTASSTAILLLAGCVTQPTTPTSHITEKFVATEAQVALEKGSNHIKGSALLRQNGGGVVTCAGMEVKLIPATAYAKERISTLYGSVDGGYRPLVYGNLNFVPDEPLYHSTIKRTLCDAQGFFKFDHLKDGEFYITTIVAWLTPSGRYSQDPQGGALSLRVNVQKGELKEIVLTAQ